MKLAIMQPYFLPYIGYWQLLSAVDTFVIYDNIEYTKKGWINRNRMLSGGEAKVFTIPLVKASDYLNVSERCISPAFDRKKLLNQVKSAYQKAAHFKRGYGILEDILQCSDKNLFSFIYFSVLKIMDALQIGTQIVISSSIDIDHSLKSSNKVLAVCKAFDASTYINPIGGVKLYDKAEFRGQNIELCFLKAKDIAYQQFEDSFVPSLSILDLLMFNSIEQIKMYLEEYTLE